MGSGRGIGGAVGGVIGGAVGGPGGAAIGSGIGGGIGGGLDEDQAQRENKRNKRKYDEARDDASMRAEANYRSGRAGLQGAIEDFYKQKGWKLPDHSTPGYGTARGLPGEAPLYGDEAVAGEAPDKTNSETTSTEDQPEMTSDSLDFRPKGGMGGSIPLDNAVLADAAMAGTREGAALGGLTPIAPGSAEAIARGAGAGGPVNVMPLYNPPQLQGDVPGMVTKLGRMRGY